MCPEQTKLSDPRARPAFAVVTATLPGRRGPPVRGRRVAGRWEDGSLGRMMRNRLKSYEAYSVACFVVWAVILAGFAIAA